MSVECAGGDIRPESELHQCSARSTSTCCIPKMAGFHKISKEFLGEITEMLHQAFQT